MCVRPELGIIVLILWIRFYNDIYVVDHLTQFVIHTSSLLALHWNLIQVYVTDH